MDSNKIDLSLRNEEIVKSEEKAKTPATRIASLDIFRGFTMIMMLIVNHQNGWPIYSGLTHAGGDGCTPTDLIFPSFLFISGMAISLSIKQEKNESKKDFYLKLLKRFAILFMLGFILNLCGSTFNFYTVRVLGVLQRIALCWAIVAIVHVTLENKIYHFIILAAFSIIYLCVM